HSTTSFEGSATEAVRITAKPGAILICAPEHFGSGDESVFRRLLGQLLAVSEVQVIEIDRSARAVAVTYDRRADLSKTLRIVAAVLGSEAADVRGNSVGDVDFDLVPSRVTRVERRRRAGGTITTIVSAGADFLAACSRFVQRKPRGAHSNGQLRGD